MTTITQRTIAMRPAIQGWGNWKAVQEATRRAGHKYTAGTETPRAVRRYTVTAHRFRCGDESGADWTGSDEVKWVFTTKLEGRTSTTLESKEYGDVDSGDTRSIGLDLVSDHAAPIGLSIQLFEIDQGRDWKSKVEMAFKTLGKEPHVGPWVAAVPEVVRGHIARMLEDDLIGSHTVLFRARDLERRLPTVGSTFIDRVYLGGKGGDLPWAVAGGPDYYLDLRVRREGDDPA